MNQSHATPVNPGHPSPSGPTEPVTFGIVAALEKEYAAMKVMLDASFEHVTERGRTYLCGQVPAKGGGVHRVALALADQGTAVATHRATLLVEDFPGVDAVLMVGIAGGVPDHTKAERHVRLGDIVVSGEKGVIAYDFVKEHSSRLEPRHPPRPPHADLYNACRRLGAAALEGKFPWLPYIQRAKHLPNSARPASETDRLSDTNDPNLWVEHPQDPERAGQPDRPRVFLGTIACANRLLKNPVHRDQLRDLHDVRAVEMEGFGIAEATWNLGTGYLVVRGVCDYCDSHKNNAWQGYAAVVAAAYARAVLEELPPVPRHRSPGTDVEDLASPPTLASQFTASAAPDLDVARRVLFDIYDPQFEQHYLVRLLDQQIEDAANFSSVWVHGAAGSGKTTAVRRRIHQTKSRMIYVGLEAAVDCDAQSLLPAFFCELSAALEHPGGMNRRTWTARQRQELEERLALEARRDSRPLAIHVDELPADSTAVHMAFVRAFAAFLIHYANKYPPPHPKYFISSILSPADHLAPSQKKISERLQFLSTMLWSEQDMTNLKELLCASLNLSLTEKDSTRLLRAASGSPRALKSILRRFITILGRENCPADPMDVAIIDERGGVR